MVRACEMVGEWEPKIAIQARKITPHADNNVSEGHPAIVGIGYWQAESSSLPREGPIQCHECLGGLLKSHCEAV